MNDLSRAFRDAADELKDIFQSPGKIDTSKLSSLNGIFHHRYLDDKMQAFTDTISQSQEGIGDIEEYLNEEDVDEHIHKRLLERVPENIFTSLGILGTFVGLGMGLKNFEPSNYEAMTTSVASLVDGIKVAFLTSIYGIAMSIVYSCGMKSEYSSLTSNLQSFLDRFHTYVMPTAESESMNILVASQKNQTAAMEQMAEKFSVQMADSFEKVITPTFQKMNDSLDVLVNSVTKCQEDAIKEILDTFLKEMNLSFKTQFEDFGRALTQLKDAQTDNTNYTTNLYQSMSRQLSEAYAEHEHMMRSMLEDTSAAQKDYPGYGWPHPQGQPGDPEGTAGRLSAPCGLSQGSTNLLPRSSGVACNQTMQKYVEAAAQGMDKITASGKRNAELAQANQQVVAEFDARLLQEFMNYQKLSYKTMDQVRRLLADISAAGSSKNVTLTAGQMTQKQSFDKLEELLEQQGDQQQALLEELNRNLRELTKGAQKGTFVHRDRIGESDAQKEKIRKQRLQCLAFLF